MMNLVLIGYRGTGKSVVGEILGNRLGMNCVGTDRRIVETAGMSIPEIVEKYGWSGFRDMESEVVRHLSQCDHLIIDTGGGVIERPENIRALKVNSFIFWLKASVETIIARIQDDTQRPSLTEGKTFTEEVGEILKQRIPKYKMAAQFEIDTDHLTPDQVADRIIFMVNEVEEIKKEKPEKIE
jgi:shikimate kinase